MGRDSALTHMEFSLHRRNRYQFSGTIRIRLTHTAKNICVSIRIREMSGTDEPIRYSLDPTIPENPIRLIMNMFLGNSLPVVAYRLPHLPS
jgi:hypothetical protein